jgi:subtilisin family serine protease
MAQGLTDAAYLLIYENGDIAEWGEEMKKLFIVSFTALFSLILWAIIGSSSKATQAPQKEYDPEEYVPDEVLVKFKEDVVGDLVQNKSLVQNIIDAIQGNIKTYLGQEVTTTYWEPSILTNRSFIGDPYLFHIKLPEGIGVDNALSFLKSLASVEYAEKNGIRRICTIPNDEDFHEWDQQRSIYRQWSLYNPEHNRSDIHAPEAWDIFTGSPDIVVAVLDTGIDQDHEDLAANLWTNPNESADGVDNDHNGFIDDLHGWDFIHNNNSPDDDNSNTYHGTHVSGILGAVGNNEIGIAGVCWSVKIMPIKVGNLDGTFIDSAIVNGIDYAIYNGAFLLNGSYGGAFSQSEQAAISRALGKGRLFIAAAGHGPSGGKDLDNCLSPVYPACYPLDNIISVLGTIDNDDIDYRSNWGLTSVDLGAPGTEIWSTKSGDLYQFLDGTSQAATHVAGVAALALGLSPGLIPSRLKSLILDNVDEVGDLWQKCVSGGRLNAYKVINAMGGSSPPTAPSTLSAYSTAWDTILVDWQDNSNNELGFEIQRKDQYQSSFIHHNSSDLNSTSYVSFQDKPIDPAQGRTYTYRVRATNKAGASSFTNTADASIPYTVPAAPTDLAAPEAVYPNVHLEWMDNANNELTFSLERRRHGTGAFSVIATIGANVTSYIDSDVHIGYTYDYRVRAYNPLGYSSFSNVITVEVENW